MDRVKRKLASLGGFLDITSRLSEAFWKLVIGGDVVDPS